MYYLMGTAIKGTDMRYNSVLDFDGKIIKIKKFLRKKIRVWYQVRNETMNS